MSIKKTGILSGSLMKIYLLMMAFVLAAPHAFAADGPKYGGTINLPRKPGSITCNNFDILRYGCMEPLTYVFEKLAWGDWAGNKEALMASSHTGNRYPVEILGPMLAESWQIAPDRLSITVQLRKGVRWHNKPPVNGRELTAEDVAWNYNRHMTSEWTDKNAAKEIETVKATGKYTLEFKLKPPGKVEMAERILSGTDKFLIVPSEVADPKDNEIKDWKFDIGTGPFIFEDYVLDSSVLLKKNPDYWGYDERHPQNKLPYADAVKFIIMGDEITKLAALRTGKVDRIYDVPVSDVLELKKSNPELNYFRGGVDASLVFKPRNETPPFDDVRVRQAMNMAMDKQAVTASIFEGDVIQNPLTLMYPGWPNYVRPEEYPDAPLWPEDNPAGMSVKEVLSYNPEKAEKLLDAAGYPRGADGIRFKTNILAASIDEHTELTEIFQAYMSQVGIEVKIDSREVTDYNTVRLGKTYDQMVVHWHWWSSTFDTTTPFTPGYLYNLSITNDKKYNEMYAKAGAEFNNEKRWELTKQMNWRAMEQAFFVSMPQGASYTVAQPWLQGTETGGVPGNFYWGAKDARLWIDQDMKTEMGK